jgi:uncharacterized protein YbjT (DUF2867 family)
LKGEGGTEMHSKDNMNESAPIVLVMGATGQNGKLIVEELKKDTGSNQVRVRLSSHKQEQVEKFKAQGLDAVKLDLDDPNTFGSALAGVERLFLLTGYTVDMLAQSKTIVDAALIAGVKHIVHLGVFAPEDTTIHHYIWHQLIECYIEARGIAWTHLHPNFFMENLLTGMPFKDGSFSLYFGDAKVGWIALEDVAATAATVLREGPEKHNGQNYWFSTESLNGYEVAAIISDVTGKPCHFEPKRPEQLTEDIDIDSIGFEPTYFKSGQDFMQQAFDGQASYIASVRNDVEKVTGKPPTTFKQWAKKHKAELLR